MTAAALATEPLPGSPEWLQLMTASKVAAVLGLSPWESRFSLWHRMRGNVGAREATKQTERGHYLEPVVAKWWCDQHPEFDVTISPGLHYAASNPRHACSPDALLYLPGPGKQPCAALEVKTAARDDMWGEQGSDDIPIYYRVQTLWQAYVLDVPRVHVAVLGSFLEFREYVIERDDTDLAIILRAVDDFMTSLDEDQAPDIDEHSATYEVVRQLHPDIDGTDVDLDPDVVHAWSSAKHLHNLAEAHSRLLNSVVLAAMGSAKRGLVDGVPVAQRIANKSGPYLKHLTPKGDL